MTVREDQRGPADRLLDVVLSSGAHLWHNRPGLEVNGWWFPVAGRARALPAGAQPVRPGLFVPAAVELYRRLLDIHRMDPELSARFEFSRPHRCFPWSERYSPPRGHQEDTSRVSLLLAGPLIPRSPCTDRGHFKISRRLEGSISVRLHIGESDHRGDLRR